MTPPAPAAWVVIIATVWVLAVFGLFVLQFKPIILSLTG